MLYRIPNRDNHEIKMGQKRCKIFIADWWIVSPYQQQITPRLYKTQETIPVAKSQRVNQWLVIWERRYLIYWNMIWNCNKHKKWIVKRARLFEYQYWFTHSLYVFETLVFKISKTFNKPKQSFQTFNTPYTF